MKKFIQYIREHHAIISFWVFALTSITLLVIGFCLPPKGEISPSVIQAVGELFAFACLGVIPSAIKEGRHIKVQKGDASIELTKE